MATKTCVDGQAYVGRKVGTGGSSGFQYLKDAADKHKVIGDLFQLTTFFVPRSKLPKLPAGSATRTPLQIHAS